MPGPACSPALFKKYYYYTLPQQFHQRMTMIAYITHELMT
jgi:hypothetical protein